MSVPDSSAIALMTQFNTPYRSTAYPTGFLRSREGLAEIQDCAGHRGDPVQGVVDPAGHYRLRRFAAGAAVNA
ncbi:MAG: hypothetical protein QM803_02575 [Rhodocyclaceae bacterium]